MRKFFISGFFSAFVVLFLIMSCQDSAKMEQANYMTNGKDIYEKNCQTCHGKNGEGLGKLVPPLTDTLFMKKYKPQLACFIKNGLDEPLYINGVLYDEKMAGFSNMADIDIAQVIVYITNSFGNNQGHYAYPLVTRDLAGCK